MGRRRRYHKFSKKRVEGKGGRTYRYCLRCGRQKIGPVPGSRCRRVAA